MMLPQRGKKTLTLCIYKTQINWPRIHRSVVHSTKAYVRGKRLMEIMRTTALLPLSRCEKSVFESPTHAHTHSASSV